MLGQYWPVAGHLDSASIETFNAGPALARVGQLIIIFEESPNNAGFLLVSAGIAGKLLACNFLQRPVSGKVLGIAGKGEVCYLGMAINAILPLPFR
jgi:hypothetical protein